MREIFEPRLIRVWRDSSANVQPCFFSHRLSSLTFTAQWQPLLVTPSKPDRARVSAWPFSLFWTETIKSLFVRRCDKIG
jgi:hypothetical protein